MCLKSDWISGTKNYFDEKMNNEQQEASVLYFKINFSVSSACILMIIE